MTVMTLLTLPFYIAKSALDTISFYIPVLSPSSSSSSSQQSNDACPPPSLLLLTNTAEPPDDDDDDEVVTSRSSTTPTTPNTSTTSLDDSPCTSTSSFHNALRQTLREKNLHNSVLEAHPVDALPPYTPPGASAPSTPPTLSILPSPVDKHVDDEHLEGDGKGDTHNDDHTMHDALLKRVSSAPPAYGGMKVVTPTVTKEKHLCVNRGVVGIRR
ncbi:hypothetical protein BC832DRAFT_253193 [Gaertneriomyces semiglobifer]|nr:hypothetical protein BC832DRAFT_253193 [Gaertneriomyces semiglobifer]